MRLTILVIIIAIIASTLAAPIDRDDLRGRAVPWKHLESGLGTGLKAISRAASGWGIYAAIRNKYQAQDAHKEHRHLIGAPPVSSGPAAPH
ncbi:uncharacterized protein B0H18DRAFT_1120866 [Fomitopsis serialis]|uniref:uncharacterized protein n=1 Tax=Fomitopsis serialis TaxID=139415 RepID=UPI002008CD7F|nr:uncharacterized protein B0H18DRAFT_1120866 [Neoantrodia serialis]KAH9922475.1 hypothetical protein B0H18DRAFT_1120866 [Neoantrodia serialis]